MRAERFELAPGAVLFRYGGDDDAANRAAIAHAAQLRSAPGVLDAIPAARSTLVLHEPGAALAEPVAGAAPPQGKRHVIRVLYFDEQIGRLHREARYRVAFIGFAPGFPYLTGLPEALRRPRLALPRTHTPPGSLAVADQYCGIYPADLPGGWELIGQTGVRLFDGERALLAAGDEVTFEAGDVEPPPARQAARSELVGAPRFGLGHHGVPPGGAMDLGALEEGNRVLGNPPHAPAMEVTLHGRELKLPRDAWVCASGAPLDGPLERGRPHFLRAGEALKLGKVRHGARSYVCIGSDAPPPRGEALAPFTTREVVLRVLRGPHVERFDFDAFLAGPWKLSPQCNRVGARLDGPKLKVRGEPETPPEGNAPGAVQVPASGVPIILGPDRPVTGGYPKVATVLAEDLALLAQARPGAAVRFVPA